MTSRLLSAIPAMPVRNVTAGAVFYSDKLGFALMHQEGGFAILKRDTVEIHLWKASDERWRSRGGDRPVVSGAESFIAGTASCRIAVSGVDALYAAYLPLGVVHNNAPITNQPWGARDFGVSDLDGNLITFYEDL